MIPASVLNVLDGILMTLVFLGLLVSPFFARSFFLGFLDSETRSVRMFVNFAAAVGMGALYAVMCLAAAHSLFRLP